MKDLALKSLSTDALPPFLGKGDTLVETKGLNVEETAGNKNEAEDINSYSKLDCPIYVVCFLSQCLYSPGQPAYGRLVGHARRA